MPRQARLDAPGTLHHVIVRGIEKHRIVDDKVDRDNFVSRMGQIAHTGQPAPPAQIRGISGKILRTEQIYGVRLMGGR